MTRPRRRRRTNCNLSTASEEACTPGNECPCMPAPAAVAALGADCGSVPGPLRQLRVNPTAAIGLSIGRCDCNLPLIIIPKPLHACSGRCGGSLLHTRCGGASWHACSQRMRSRAVPRRNSQSVVISSSAGSRSCRGGRFLLGDTSPEGHTCSSRLGVSRRLICKRKGAITAASAGVAVAAASAALGGAYSAASLAVRTAMMQLSATATTIAGYLPYLPALPAAAASLQALRLPSLHAAGAYRPPHVLELVQHFLA